MRALYNVVLHLALPLVLLRLWWRGRREPGYRVDWAQRFGRYAPWPVPGLLTAQHTEQAVEQAVEQAARQAARQAAGQAANPASSARQPLIWLHAVSLGETLAAQPLIAALRARYPQHRLLVTHMTATGREAAERLYGRETGSQAESAAGGNTDHAALIAFLPYDLSWAVNQFFDHFAPVLGIVMETEVWPNLFHAAQARGMPLLLANARMSEKSYAGYQRFRSWLRPAFGALQVCAQSAADAARLSDLGAQLMMVTGNLKFDTAPAAAPAAQVQALRQMAGTRPVFLAASTREGEEELLLDGLTRHPLDDATIIIVPRHPQRFDAVAALLARRGLTYVRRSENRALPARCNILLGDSMGEMPAYYAVADCAFIGGSLVPVGGQNMIEAAALGVPALFGPHTFNFAEAAQQAVAVGAAIRVVDADGVCTQAAALLRDAARRSAMGEAGRAFCAAHRGATARTMEAVERLLVP